jgi:hypothetical protein
MQLRRRLHFHPAAESACQPWQPAAASWKSHRVAPLLQSDSAAATRNFDRLELHRTRKARESHHMFLWEPFVQLRGLNRKPAREKEAPESRSEQKERISQSVEPAEAHS